MSQTIVLDFEVKSPIERVWNALTDSATLSRWMLFKTNDFQPVVGHTFRFRDAPGWDGVVDCEVLEADEPHRLSYTWVSGDASSPAHSTVVTWTLEQGDDGVTLLHLEHSGFGSEAKQEFGGAKYGWTSMLNELRKVLAEE